jgi:hypothetical protein
VPVASSEDKYASSAGRQVSGSLLLDMAEVSARSGASRVGALVLLSVFDSTRYETLSEEIHDEGLS